MNKAEDKLIEKLKEKLKEKPEESYPDERGKIVDYDTFIAAIEKVSPVKIWFTEDTTYGHYSRPDKEIVIRADMSEKDTMKAVIHEVAYASCREQEQRENFHKKKRWTVKMMEGAAVDYMVCDYFGLDQADYFSGNITDWGKGMDMEELLSSMEFIRKTAGNLIDSIVEKMQGRRRDGIKKGYQDEDLEDLQMLIQESAEAKAAANKNKGYEEQDINFSYYVVNDAYGKKEESIYQYFDNLDLAFHAYAALPNHLNKQIGMEDSGQRASKMFLIDCLNGWDEIRDLNEGLPNEKWVCEETRKALRKAQSYVDNHETEIAYKAGKGFFTIRTVSDGYDYTIYDQDLKKLDGGIFDCPNFSVRDAMTHILHNDNIRAEECQVIDYGEFQGKVEISAQEKQYLEEKEAEGKQIEKTILKTEKKTELKEKRPCEKPSVLSALRKRQSKIRERKKEKVKQMAGMRKNEIMR